MYHRIQFFAVTFGVFFYAFVGAHADVVKAGGTEVWLDKPASPKASLVLVPGEGGMSERDPLQRARKEYIENGFAVLSVDKKTRISPAMKYMAKIAKPVYLAAVSQGVSKVAHLMAGGRFKTKGLILVSGNLEYVREKVKDPNKLSRTLVIHHKQDGCDKTSPDQVDKFKEWGGNKVKVLWLDGGRDKGNACGPNSYHGLAGLNDQVVAAISKFLQ